MKTAFMCLLLLFSFPFQQPALKAQDYYPLQPRNIWSYRIFYNPDPWPVDSTTEQLGVLGDTLMPNGLVYTRLARPDILGATFVRVDSQHIHYYSPYAGVDVPMYNLRAAVGSEDTIHDWGPIGRSRVENVFTETIFGSQRTMRNYLVYGLVSYEVSLAEGLGIVNAYDYDDGFCTFYCAWWRIRGCVIRDTLYGTTVDVPAGQEQPTATRLDQNYPNPFNPVTGIRFQVAGFSLVSLGVYDLLGREVATLVNQVKPPGTYTVQWDATGMPSGVYMCRLTAAGSTQVKKLVLTK